MIGHNPELKGDVHPIQCPVNTLGEVNEEYTYGKHPELRMLLMVKLKKPSMPPSAGLECI